MNIIAMIERIKVLIDHTTSPRYTNDQFDTAINIVSNQILDDRYDNIKRKRPYSFQSMQRLRDELWTLSKSVTFAMTSDILTAVSIKALGDYRYALLCTLTVNGTDYDCNPMSYSEWPSKSKNPYTRAQITEPDRLYWIESAVGLTFMHGSSYVPTSLVMDYLKTPTSVYSGQVGTNATVFVIGNVIIALTTTVYHGVTYSPGQEITIVAGFLSITSGTVTYNYVNSEFPDAIQDEICMKAASFISKGVQDYQKGVSIERDANTQ